MHLLSSIKAVGMTWHAVVGPIVARVAGWPPPAIVNWAPQFINAKEYLLCQWVANYSLQITHY